MTLNGIDISSYQSGIDLTVVPCDFVIIKATQGTGYVNPDCDRAYQQAKRAGKLRGTYHYVGGGNAVAEADYYVNNIKGYIRDGLLAIDWEAEQNGAWGNEAYLEQLVRRVIERTGVKPLIYSMASRYAQVAAVAKKLDCGLWIAEYADMNPTGYQAHPWREGAYACAIRQYASTGRLNGWGGGLDLNIAYFDRDMWRRYANPNTANKTPAANIVANIKKENPDMHVIFRKKGTQELYVADMAAGQYRHIPSMNVLKTMKYVYSKTGEQCKTWAQCVGAKEEYGDVAPADMAAFGVLVKDAK